MTPATAHGDPHERAHAKRSDGRRSADTPADTKRHHVAVVVVTYAAAPGMLERCIESVLTNSPTTHDRLITVEVVDNGNTAAGRVGALDGVTDRVTVTTTGHNDGFAAAVNTGFRHGREAGADFLVCLNDDITVTEGWMDPLVDALSSNPRLGGVQPLLVNVDREQIDGAGVQIDRFGAGSDRLRGEAVAAAKAVEVEALTGGAAMFRADFVDDVGPMDERFFLYYEDVEWCRRGRRAGWSFELIPDSIVAHVGSATTAALGNRVLALQERNRLWSSILHGSAAEIAAGLGLSVRRLRHPPRRTHLIAFLRGLAGSPTRLVQRWRR